MGDVVIAVLPAVILAAVLWAVSVALKPRQFGVSEAERYQAELAARSRAHYEAQVRDAMAARAYAAAATLPSQNEQQQSQQAAHARATPGAEAAFVPDAGHPGRVLPGGQLSPELALQLRTLATSGRKAQAIRLLRRATRTDLLTAKQYIDRL
jgi:hypothetical protein